MIKKILIRMIKNLISPKNLEKTSSRKTMSKMTKTTTDTRKIRKKKSMVDADQRSPTTICHKKEEMNTEDQEAIKVNLTGKEAKDTHVNISNLTPIEAMMTSM